jgi:hypothetical protein
MLIETRFFSLTKHRLHRQFLLHLKEWKNRQIFCLHVKLLAIFQASTRDQNRLWSLGLERGKNLVFNARFFLIFREVVIEIEAKIFFHIKPFVKNSCRKYQRFLQNLAKFYDLWVTLRRVLDDHEEGSLVTMREGPWWPWGSKVKILPRLNFFD